MSDIVGLMAFRIKGATSPLGFERRSTSWCPTPENRRSRPIALFGIRLFSGSDMMMTKLSAAMPALVSQNDLLDSTSGIYREWPRLQPSSVEFLDRSIEFMSDLSRYLETIVVFICYTNFFLDNDPLVIIIRVGFFVRGITNSLRKQISLKYKK